MLCSCRTWGYYYSCKVFLIRFFTKKKISDGVHDNFDPQTLGITPHECGLPVQTWVEAEEGLPNQCNRAKNNFRLFLFIIIYVFVQNYSDEKHY